MHENDISKAICPLNIGVGFTILSWRFILARAYLKLEANGTHHADFTFEFLLLSVFNIQACISWNSLGQSMKL